MMDVIKITPLVSKPGPTSPISYLVFLVLIHLFALFDIFLVPSVEILIPFILEVGRSGILILNVALYVLSFENTKSRTSFTFRSRSDIYRGFFDAIDIA